MVARKLFTPSTLAVGLSVGLLAQHATAAEAVVVLTTPVIAEVTVDGQMFRSEIDSYLRALNQEMRTTLGEDLRRSLAPKIELASNELRARG